MIKNSSGKLALNNGTFIKKSVQECLRNQNSHLNTKLQLSSLKNKKVGKKVRNVLSAKCTVSTLFCQNIVYKNVYEIKIHACTPSSSPLA